MHTAGATGTPSEWPFGTELVTPRLILLPQAAFPPQSPGLLCQPAEDVTMAASVPAQGSGLDQLHSPPPAVAQPPPLDLSSLHQAATTQEGSLGYTAFLWIPGERSASQPGTLLRSKLGSSLQRRPRPPLTHPSTLRDIDTAQPSTGAWALGDFCFVCF